MPWYVNFCNPDMLILCRGYIDDIMLLIIDSIKEMDVKPMVQGV